MSNVLKTVCPPRMHSAFPPASSVLAAGRPPAVNAQQNAVQLVLPQQKQCRLRNRPRRNHRPLRHFFCERGGISRIFGAGKTGQHGIARNAVCRIRCRHRLYHHVQRGFCARIRRVCRKFATMRRSRAAKQQDSAPLPLLHAAQRRRDQKSGQRIVQQRKPLPVGERCRVQRLLHERSVAHAQYIGRAGAVCHGRTGKRIKSLRRKCRYERTDGNGRDGITPREQVSKPRAFMPAVHRQLRAVLGEQVRKFRANAARPTDHKGFFACKYPHGFIIAQSRKKK